VAIAALALLAVLAVVFVALPLVREPSAADVLPALTPEQLERLALEERRDAAYAALRELELELRTGKLGDEDYARSVAALRAEAIEALRGLEALDAAAAPDAADSKPAAAAPGEAARLADAPLPPPA
jgi:hypothetical protein